MIVKFLKTQEIKKDYPNKKINEDLRWEATPGSDYIVISIETVIEKNDEPKTSIRYWIINDEERLIPYDAYNFKIIDSYFPTSWIIDLNEKGVSLSHPKWIQHGYVEDYFDNIKTEKEYNKIIKTIFDKSVEAALKNGLQLNLGIKKIWTKRLFN